MLLLGQPISGFPGTISTCFFFSSFPLYKYFEEAAKCLASGGTVRRIWSILGGIYKSENGTGIQSLSKYQPNTR